MTRLSIAFLSVLLPTALAFPQYVYKPSGGYLTGAPYATGGPKTSYGPTAPYGQQNSTVMGPIGTGTGIGSITIPVSSVIVTVLPLPVSTTTKETPSDSLSSGNNDIKSPNVDFENSSTESSNSVSNYGNTESPNSISKKNDSCGPATVVVTSRNTVTVTVGIPASSELPIHIASPLLSYVHKHGYHHKGLHHKSSSSSLFSSISVVSETPLASDTTKPVVTTPEASSKLATPSTPVLEITTPVAYKPLVPSSSEEASSIQPVTPQVYNAAPSLKMAPSSSSIETSSTLAAFKALVSSSTSSETSSSVLPVTPQVYNAAPSSKKVPTSSASLKATSSPVYYAPASTAAAAQPAPSTPSTSSPGTKRGLVYNSAALTQPFSSSSAISWCYNWDSQPGGDVPSNFNFVPMMWGPIEVHTSNWKTNADSAIAKGSTHLLGFNEPDLPAQANLTPQQAAQSWNTYMEPYAGKAKLGSPAVCNGGGLTGLNWLNSFFDACSGCTIDFVPIHWYGLANDAGVADFKDHTAKAIAAAKGKPVWITEFKPDGSPEEMASFMSQILPFLDSCEGVERYSWFEVDGILVSGGSLTSLGSKYAA